MKLALVAASFAAVELANAQGYLPTVPGLAGDTLVSGLIGLNISSLTCTQCKALLQVVDIAWNYNYNQTTGLISAYCGLEGLPAPFCTGLVRELGPSLLYALNKISYYSLSSAAADADYVCPILVKNCPFPYSSAPLTFTIANATNATSAPPTTFNSSVAPLTVLHLSDMHIDPLYAAGTYSQCSYYLCCRNETNTLSKTGNASKLCSTWGDYNSDAPPKLVANMFANMRQTIGKPIDFTIFTGDIAPHDIWETTTDTTDFAVATGYNLTKQYLNGSVWPAVGNHEASPVNLMAPYEYTDAPVNGLPKQMYQFLSQQWAAFLTPEQQQSVVSGQGVYSAKQGGLRILSLNTVMCYVDNFYTLIDNVNFDKGGQLAFLNSELAKAEANNEPVWIIAHIAPGDSACSKNWSSAFSQLVKRYKNTIRGQYFGHTHRDELSMYYADIGQTQPIGFAFLAPSVTPYTDLNPGYSVYSIDPLNYQLIDKKVYIANLSLAQTWDRTGGSPQWFQEYSARDYLPNWPANRYLDAEFWNQVVTQMNVDGGNNPTFNTYFSYRGKSAGLDQTNMLNVTGFRQQLICDIKAGNSAQECSRPSILKRDLPQGPSVSNQGHGGRWWKKELCSNHHGDVGSMLSFMRE